MYEKDRAFQLLSTIMLTSVGRSSNSPLILAIFGFSGADSSSSTAAIKI